KYLYSIFPVFPVIIATMVLLFLFLILTISGIGESSIVAVIIFVIHLSVLLLLICSGIYYVTVNGFHIASVNFHTPLQGSLANALFLGFSTAMLGITGFETS